MQVDSDIYKKIDETNKLVVESFEDSLEKLYIEIIEAFK